MAAKEIDIPEQVTDKFIHYLYEEVGETEAIAYQQLRLQKQAGAMGRTMVGILMESTFGVQEVPEDTFEANIVPGEL